MVSSNLGEETAKLARGAVEFIWSTDFEAVFSLRSGNLEGLELSRLFFVQFSGLGEFFLCFLKFLGPTLELLLGN